MGVFIRGAVIKEKFFLFFFYILKASNSAAVIVLESPSLHNRPSIAVLQPAHTLGIKAKCEVQEKCEEDALAKKTSQEWGTKPARGLRVVFSAEPHGHSGFLRTYRAKSAAPRSTGTPRLALSRAVFLPPSMLSRSRTRADGSGLCDCRAIVVMSKYRRNSPRV